MSIDKLKKQSKNLLQLLPDFVRDHGAELRLADCQELVARIHGFPNWHIASARATAAANAPQPPVAPSEPEFDIRQENGETWAALPGTDRILKTKGDDPEVRERMVERLRAMRDDHQRRQAAQAEGVPALKRLFEIAHGDSGQCRYVARLLLGLYNGQRFPFDLTDLRGLDTEIFDDCMRVLRMDATPQREVHTYFEKGGARFEQLAQRWRIADMLRLKNICEQVQERGVVSFGGEDRLDQEIKHAFANTWPE